MILHKSLILKHFFHFFVDNVLHTVMVVVFQVHVHDERMRVFGGAILSHTYLLKRFCLLSYL